MVDRIGASPAAAAHAAPITQGSIRPGIQSGLAGGLAMLVLLALAAAAGGLGWLHPLQAIGATFADAGASGGAAAIATGAAVHAVVSVALGVALAALLPKDFPRVSAVAVGGAYGLLVAGLMMSLVVPAASPAFRASIQPYGGSWTIGHVAFGSTLGLALTLRHRASTRAMKRAPSVAGTAQPT